MCNGPNEPVCRGFGYRSHQPGPLCPTPPPPSDPLYQSLSDDEKLRARTHWWKDILKEQQELAERRIQEYGL